MDLALDGRVVLITGVGSGIGRATALLAAAEGAVIAAIDVDDKGLDSFGVHGRVDEAVATGSRIGALTADDMTRSRRPGPREAPESNSRRRRRAAAADGTHHRG